MNDASLLAQIESIEMQLAMVKAQLKKRQAEQQAKPAASSFADLEGIWAGKRQFSESEIDAALYTFDAENFDVGDTEKSDP